ncbi:ABC transporter ATP-binding protein [Sphingomonas sp. LR55]
MQALDLDALADIPVRLLSTGQRRRASIARVAATGAPVWLLDEPANGLDLTSITRLEALIARHRSSGGIVLVATHLPLSLPGAREIAL